MRNKVANLLMLLILTASVLIIYPVSAREITLTLSDAELSTEFAKKWGPATVTITDIPGLGVRFDFTGLGSSGTGICDDYPVSQKAGGDPDNIGGWGNFRKYTQYRLLFTNLGPNPVSVNIDMNTGWTGPPGTPARDTYYGNSWTYLAVGESKVVTLDFSAAGEVWNAEDDPVPEWRYPGGTSGVIVRRLDEVSRIGFQVCGNGAGSVVVSATTPSDVVLTLSDEELNTQFAKETGPGTFAVTDISGPGVRFDFVGLSSSTGTVVGDNFPVSGLAGGAWKDYGNGFAGPYDFSVYSRYCLLFINVGPTSVKVNLKMNTGWTDPPWGKPENDTFWQNSWTEIPPGQSRIVTLDFWSAEVWNSMDDPILEWRYPDGTSGVIVRRLDQLSDIGFQILGEGDASIIVSGELTLTLSDAELSTQFAKETGPGTLSAIIDIPGPGVKFDFVGLSSSTGTVVGDNFPVSALAGGGYKTYGVTQQFSTWGDFSGYDRYQMIFTNIGPNPVIVNLKLNTGWTVPPPEYAAAWRDTFWQNNWTYIAPGESETVTLDFSSAEVYNAGDEQEYGARPDGTTGIAIWRLDEVSDIGFQILGEDTASIIVSAYAQPFEVYVDDDYTSSTPGWGYDHFNIIQDGIDAVAEGGKVHVYDGTYVEQLIINKNIVLQGYAGATIVAPDIRNTYTFPESTATWDPIIFAFGGTESGGAVSGSDTITVTIDGFEIDGGNKAAATPRFAGIIYRNVNSGVISNNILHDLFDADGEGDGPQTFGILVYGDSDVVIEHNEISEFSRGGIGVAGDAGTLSDPEATVQFNTVMGNGFELGTGWWAENGIQIAYGATAHVKGNDVFYCTVNNPYWSATGIMAVDTDGVYIESNYVEGCDIGIAASDFPGSLYGSPWDYHILSNVEITNNTLVGNTWQIDISNDARNVVVTYNNITNAVEDGIDVWSYPGAGVAPTDIEIHFNNIEGSGGYGIWAGEDLTEPVNATLNWWGHETGPYHGSSWEYMGAPYGPHYGLGDAVSDYVLYYPWLREPSGAPVEPPTASFNYMPTEPKAGETVTFDASGSAANGGTIVEYAWNFGDGNNTSTSEEIISHIYDTPGTYNVTLTVTDSEGLTDSTWQLITVVPAIVIVHDVAVTNVTTSMNQTYQGRIVMINVTVANLGNGTETFTLTLYYDSTVIGTRLVENLAPNATLQFSFAWNTTNVPYCHNYTIKAVASTVPGETSIENNTFIDGQVKIKIMGDVNGDGTVSFLDAIVCGAAFGSTPEDPNWNPQADLVQDGYINFLDIILLGINFNASCP